MVISRLKFRRISEQRGKSGEFRSKEGNQANLGTKRELSRINSVRNANIGDDIRSVWIELQAGLA